MGSARVCDSPVCSLPAHSLRIVSNRHACPALPSQFVCLWVSNAFIWPGIIISRRHPQHSQASWDHVSFLFHLCRHMEAQRCTSHAVGASFMRAHVFGACLVSFLRCQEGRCPAQQRRATSEEKVTSLPRVGRATWGERPQPARRTGSFSVTSVLLGLAQRPRERGRLCPGRLLPFHGI